MLFAVAIVQSSVSVGATGVADSASRDCNTLAACVTSLAALPVVRACSERTATGCKAAVPLREPEMVTGCEEGSCAGRNWQGGAPAALRRR